MAATVTTFVHLKPKPGSCYKQLFVHGRIPTWIIHAWHKAPPPDGMSIEKLAADWSIPVEAVPEVLAYCESSPLEMVEDTRREEALMEATGMNDPNYKFNPHPKLIPLEEVARILRS